MLFPNARYDDQANSTAQALAWAQQRPAANATGAGWRKRRRDSRRDGFVEGALGSPAFPDRLATMTGRDPRPAMRGFQSGGQ
jgi:hypothetical protein